MTEDQRAEHNRAFAEAAGIVNAELPLTPVDDTTAPSEPLRRKLARALELFDRVVQLNPKNWSALWMMGRIHRRVGDGAAALDCFECAHLANPAQPEVLRLASRCAMDLGRHDHALALAQRAVQLDPNSAVFRANLALACLLSRRLPEAQLAVSQALAGDPADTQTQLLKAIIQHFAAKRVAPPPNTPALFQYWRENGGG